MSKYYKYTLKALSPIRIADDSTSQSGQTDTMTYIPGSTVRGMVISRLASEGLLDQYKKAFISEEICFYNSFLTTGEHDLIPSLKGFNEGKKEVKGKKKIDNFLLKGELKKGNKQASLGEYCYIAPLAEEDASCIRYYSVKRGSDLKIKMYDENRENQMNMFRNEYIAQGQFFSGYIRLSDNEELNKAIENILAENKNIYIGNARSAGLGKCLITAAKEVDDVPYQAEYFSAQNEVYMVLLSDTVMRNEAGDLEGLNLSELATKLGVNELKVSYAATGIRNVSAYNSRWGTRTKTIPMYTAGSVFHLSFKGTISENAMKQLCETGIGVRKNEGCGRILFVKDYAAIQYKEKQEYQYTLEKKQSNPPALSPNEQATVRVAARGYFNNQINRALERYVLEKPLRKGSLSSSQLGTVRSIITQFRYQPLQAKENLTKFFSHANAKEQSQKIQKAKGSFGQLERRVLSILDMPIIETLFEDGAPFKETGKVMGIPISELLKEEEEARIKLKLLVELIRFLGKGEN